MKIFYIEYLPHEIYSIIIKFRKSSSCLFIFFSRMNEILYFPLCRIILDTNLQTSGGKSEEYRAEQAIPLVLPTTAELLNILLSI